jgi:uncharacterized protein YkwD
MDSHRRILIGVLTVLLGALLVASIAPGPAAAKRRACEDWAHQGPTSLTRPQARKSVICLVNRERRARGQRALHRSGGLQRAAQRHNDQMTGTGCFSHQCPGESTLEGRLLGAGYLRGGLRAWAFSENLAWGLGPRGAPSAAVGAWMNSPEHRANLLNSSLRDIGVGFASGSPMSRSDGAGLYTVDFGFRTG